MTALSGVTAYDGVMLLIVVFTTIHGFWKGATWQIAPIMSLVLGYMVAMPMSITTAHYFGEPPQNRLFALVTIYIGVSLVVYLLFRSFRAGIDKAKLTEFDRHIGALLGALKGVLLTLATTVGLLIYSTMAREIILKSESSTITAKIINAVYPILPQAMHQILRPYLHQLNSELPLDLHDDETDGSLNNSMLPQQAPALTPTNSNARRSTFDDEAPIPNRRARRTVIEDNYDNEPAPVRRAPPARRRVPQYDDQDTQENWRRDSANSNSRRYRNDVPDVQDQSDVRDRRSAIPTPTDEEDDPFHPGKSDRRSSSRKSTSF